MTILDFLKGKKIGDKPVDKVLEVIRDEYMGAANENYTLTVDNDGKIFVRTPSLKKKNEFEYTDVSEYDYGLIMCMTINDDFTQKHQEYIIQSFLRDHATDISMICSDVNMIEELKIKVKQLMKKIEYISYIAIGGIILLSVLLILNNNLSSASRGVVAASTLLLFILSIYEQCTKDKQVKGVIDGYITTIKTEWYRNVIKKQYVFLCNLME